MKTILIGYPRDCINGRHAPWETNTMYLAGLGTMYTEYRTFGYICLYHCEVEETHTVHRFTI